MNKKKVARRSRVKPFVRVINYAHIMPTRYSFDIESTSAAKITSESIKDLAARKEIRKELKSTLEKKYKTGESKWFFEKLHF